MRSVAQHVDGLCARLKVSPTVFLKLSWERLRVMLARGFDRSAPHFVPEQLGVPRSRGESSRMQVEGFDGVVRCLRGGRGVRWLYTRLSTAYYGTSGPNHSGLLRAEFLQNQDRLTVAPIFLAGVEQVTARGRGECVLTAAAVLVPLLANSRSGEPGNPYLRGELSQFLLGPEEVHTGSEDRPVRLLYLQSLVHGFHPELKSAASKRIAFSLLLTAIEENLGQNWSPDSHEVQFVAEATSAPGLKLLQGKHFKPIGLSADGHPMFALSSRSPEARRLWALLRRYRGGPGRNLRRVG